MTVVSWPTTSVSETLLCSALIKCHICHIYLSAAFFLLDLGCRHRGSSLSPSPTRPALHPSKWPTRAVWTRAWPPCPRQPCPWSPPRPCPRPFRICPSASPKRRTSSPSCVSEVRRQPIAADGDVITRTIMSSSWAAGMLLNKRATDLIWDYFKLVSATYYLRDWTVFPCYFNCLGIGLRSVCFPLARTQTHPIKYEE